MKPLQVEVALKLSTSPGFGYTDHYYDIIMSGVNVDEFTLRSPYGTVPDYKAVCKKVKKQVQEKYDLLAVDGHLESSIHLEFEPIKLAQVEDMEIEVDADPTP